MEHRIRTDVTRETKHLNTQVQNTHSVLSVEIKKHLSSYLSSSGSDSVKNRSSRAAAVCLVLLCVLLLTAVIVLCVHIHTNNTDYTQERDELLTKINSLTEERNQILTNITNLTEDKDELQTKINGLTEDRDQLLTNITNFTEERDELIIKNRNLLNERQQLINQLQLLCKEGKFLHSMYLGCGLTCGACYFYEQTSLRLQTIND